MSRPTPPTRKTWNRPAHDETIKRRGWLTIWFDPEMNWWAAPTDRWSSLGGGGNLKAAQSPGEHPPTQPAAATAREITP
jgi:hypothetical protein